MILFLGTAGVAPAQVSLRLMDQVEAPGRNAHEGSSLPPGTHVVVLQEPGTRALTLENAGVPRKELAHRVLDALESRTDSLRLSQTGRVDEDYLPTSASGQIYYVVARTPHGSLYESYVNIGDGFVPGFDAVQSGRMTMGPVPETARDRMAASFRVAAESTRSGDPSASDADPASAEPTARSGPGDSVSVSTQTDVSVEQNGPSAQNQRNRSDASAGTSAWWLFLLGTGLGVVAGGGAAWLVTRTQMNEAIEERDQLQQQLRQERNEAYRSVAGMTGSHTSDSSDDVQKDATEDEEVERLRSENERLREKTKRLEQTIEKTRQYVQGLRNENDESATDSG